MITRAVRPGGAWVLSRVRCPGPGGSGGENRAFVILQGKPPGCCVENWLEQAEGGGGSTVKPGIDPAEPGVVRPGRMTRRCFGSETNRLPGGQTRSETGLLRGTRPPALPPQVAQPASAWLLPGAEARMIHKAPVTSGGEGSSPTSSKDGGRGSWTGAALGGWTGLSASPVPGW